MKKKWKSRHKPKHMKFYYTKKRHLKLRRKSDNLFSKMLEELVNHLGKKCDGSLYFTLQFLMN